MRNSVHLASSNNENFVFFRTEAVILVIPATSFYKIGTSSSTSILSLLDITRKLSIVTWADNFAATNVINRSLVVCQCWKPFDLASIQPNFRMP